jgi:site-specific recombinase
MPNWQPNWQNVRWDWGAADEAATALRRAADRLEQSASDRSAVAREAQAEWRGTYRERFDEHLSRILRGAHDLASQCREAASRIARASQQAADEQRHREQERERWQRERDEEERAQQRR